MITTTSEHLILREPKISELKELVPVYQEAFTKHHIFRREPKEILKYLEYCFEKQAKSEGGFIVAILNKKIVGGILVKREAEDLHGHHTLWKFNHLGVAKNIRGKGIGVALMKAAEDKIRKMITDQKIKTAKIEINVSENEKSIISFYKKFGFSIEGELASHYRWK